jgi:ABC transport system ATP-binding/permease protein
VNREATAPLVSIRFVSGPLSGQTFTIQKPRTTIGRDVANDIVVRDMKVSRQHACLFFQDGKWGIERLSQTTSTAVNGQKIQQPVPIANNGIVQLGDDSSFVFLMTAPSTNPMPRVQDERGYQTADMVSSGTAYLQPTPPALSPRDAFSSFGGIADRPDATQITPLDRVKLPSLEITTYSAGDSKKAYVLAQPIMNIGRDATNEIIINERIVSGLHLRIVRQGTSYVLIHPHPDRPKTMNGLLYQGRKIRGDEAFSKTLEKGDIFRIGDENGTIVTLTYNDGTGTEQELSPSIQPIKLDSPELTIGRYNDNSLVLNHPQVSAHHARLIREGGTYRILDQNSTNHVYVNAALVTNHVLRLGDEIRIGPYKLIFDGNQLRQFDESNFIRIDAQNLRKTGNNDVVLLNNITLTIPPRKFVALVGGSGTGKSTLMDALNGLRPVQQGTVTYNGQDYYKNMASFSTLLGYVPQDDIIHRDLTVERALYYAAKFRLPSDFTQAQIEQRISEVLEDVDMSARRKLPVKRLSGGQRKRASIAMELLGNPSIFFLDEPTSGLDPGLDRKMMYLLRKLADAGHTIVLVTHATNNISVCDYVCFLAQGGRLAYFGPPDGAKTYFNKTDFAEIYSSLEPSDENRNVPDEAEAKFKLSKEYQEYIVAPLKTLPAASKSGLNGHTKTPKRVKSGNPFKQFALLSQRNLELLKNDRSNLIILLLQAPLIALLLMLLVRFEVGSGLFNSGNVVQCTPHIFTSSAVSQTNPSGLLGPSGQGQKTSIDCNKIVSFLKSDPNGIAYVQTKKDTPKQSQALQDFILPGVGLNADRALFIIAFVAVLFGSINGTREIVKEASIYRRERTANLGLVPYVLSKFMILGLLSLVQSAALLLIVDLFENFQGQILLPVLLENYITLALTALAGLAIGLAASAFAANEDSANSLLPFILLPQVVFAGVEIPIKDWALQIPAMLFPTRWGVTALGTSAGLHSDKLGGDSLYGSNTTFHGTLFSTFTSTEAAHRLLLSWGALGVLIIVLIIVICIGLKRKDIRV